MHRKLQITQTWHPKNVADGQTDRRSRPTTRPAFVLDLLSLKSDPGKNELFQKFLQEHYQVSHGLDPHCLRRLTADGKSCCWKG